MKSRRTYAVAVIGGGPAGLVAALTAAKDGRTALVLNRLPNANAQPRIDVIPARTLALLTELGVAPRAIGAERLHDQQLASWADATPRVIHGSPTAHIERPALELALFDLVRRHGEIDILLDGARPKFEQVFIGVGWRARYLIDASGRAAITAEARSRPRPAWASRFFWTPRDSTHATPEFRIAALPGGYAYRLGSAYRIGIGMVGPGRFLKSDIAGLARVLSGPDARWLSEDMPPLQSMTRGASGVTSVQWASVGQAALVGDASIGRDPLSSQGLAASLSDALYAVAAIRSGKTNVLCERQAENLHAHLIHLKSVLTECRYRRNTNWQVYEEFVTGKIDDRIVQRSPALRHGHLAFPERSLQEPKL